MQLQGGTPVFARADILLNKMLRWGLRTAPHSTRVSVLYLASNSTNMQVLC
jgi:hypothetical protein